MPSHNPNAPRHSSPTHHPVPTDHRARIVAEAVVSAYIHELAQPARPRQRGDVHTDFVAAGAPAVAPSPPRARPLSRARGGAMSGRRRRALELAT